MDCRKISADLYIDDKQLGGLPDWIEIDRLVRRHELYPVKHQKHNVLKQGLIICE